MVFRLFIDVLRSRMEIREVSDRPEGLAERPSLLDIRVNLFIPRDFVFRCKVVQSPIAQA
jgi:hypothetical protein